MRTLFITLSTFMAVVAKPTCLDAKVAYQHNDCCNSYNLDKVIPELSTAGPVMSKDPVVIHLETTYVSTLPYSTIKATMKNISDTLMAGGSSQLQASYTYKPEGCGDLCPKRVAVYHHKNVQDALSYWQQYNFPQMSGVPAFINAFTGIQSLDKVTYISSEENIAHLKTLHTERKAAWATANIPEWNTAIFRVYDTYNSDPGWMNM